MSGQKSGTDGKKVVVAHRHTLVRQALAGLLRELGFGPVAEAESSAALLRISTRERPDIVLVEWELGDDSEETVSKLASLEPKPVVVMLVPPDSQTPAAPALKAGVNGFLSLNISAEELGDTLRLLSRGGVIVSGEMAGALAAEDEGGSPHEGPGGLSGREREVLGLVASGATNREIAQALVVTENTVKVHLRNVLDKLKLRNRQQAAAFAVREGIVVEMDLEQWKAAPAGESSSFDRP